MTHNLKILYLYAQLHFRGLKDWELREFDRPFAVGDTIRFTVLEFGFVYYRKITHIYSDPSFGLADNYIIISISNQEEKL